MPAAAPAHDVLAVVPAFNESGRIGEVVTGLLNLSLPVLVVDDGSRDATADEARAAGAQVFSQPNGGKGKAILAGCRWAVEQGYRGVLLLDGDGQHDPAEAGGLIRAWRRGAELVIGKRMLKIEDQPLYRRYLNRLSSLLVTAAAGRRFVDSQSGYRLCDPRLLLRMPFTGCRYDLETEMCVLAARSGRRIAEVPITAIYNDKKSGVHPVIDTYRFFRAVLRSLLRGRGELAID
jgi:glycosyltransferase involved in cell wall biosynthesis